MDFLELSGVHSTNLGVWTPDGKTASGGGAIAAVDRPEHAMARGRDSRPGGRLKQNACASNDHSSTLKREVAASNMVCLGRDALAACSRKNSSRNRHYARSTIDADHYSVGVHDLAAIRPSSIRPWSGK